MKKITRFLLLMFAFTLTSTVVLAQTMSTEELRLIKQHELQLQNQQDPVDGVSGSRIITAAPPVPITSFPFTEDFESGSLPAEFGASSGDEADVRIDAAAANGSSYGLLFEGNTSSGYSTPSSYATAFDASHEGHFATIEIIVEPDGSPGDLKMMFDLMQGYSFNTNYSWFRTLINGNPLYDVNGDDYWQPSSHSDPFQTLEFDLSSYQVLPTFTITLQTSNKYYIDYYQQGDIAFVDNFELYYFTIGDVEGYVHNGDGLAIAGATVWIEGYPSVETDPSGFYQLQQVPATYQDVNAGKEGYNIITENFYITPGGTTTHDFVLTQPSLTINPLFFDEVLAPGEYLTTYLGILNTGDGDGNWSAEIVYPSKAPKAGATINPGLVVRNKHVTGNQIHSVGADPNAKSNYTNGSGMRFGENMAWISAPSSDELFKMNMNDFSSSLVGASATDPSSGDFMNNDETTMYVSANWGSDLYSVDVATGAATLVASFSGQPSGFGVNGMACDPTSGIMYVGMTDATLSSSQIGTLDISTGVITAIGSASTVEPGLIDIAIDGAGQMYGWGIVNDISVLIDKATGTMVELGPLGVNLNYGQGGNWNADDNQIYMTSYSSSAELLILDPVTGGTASASSLPGSQMTAFGVPRTGSISGWLTLGYYEGTVPAGGGTQNVPVIFNATGTEVGDVYHAEIDLTTSPDVGTFNIPVTMTIFGDPFDPVTDLEVELINMVTGQVNLSWEFNTTNPTFQYFSIKRDGTPVGTTTDMSYIDFPPTFGTYCYEVFPVYQEGSGAPAGPECIDWLIPTLCWDPNTVYNEQWPDVEEEVILTLENCGDGMLDFTFPDYVSGSRFACDMQIALLDTYGDGWNGGSLDVFVNGNLVLDDITLASGSGPAFFSFPAEGGDNISTVITVGTYSGEQYYEIYDGDGTLIYTSPTDYSLPEGTVFGTCPQPSFIIDVDPAIGQIPSGSTLDIILTYSSNGFPAGLWDEYLKLNTNDPLMLEDSILNQMLVYIPGKFYGNVTDCNSGIGMESVTVTATGDLGEVFETTTDGSGNYEMYVDEDTYDVDFSLLGFDSYVEVDVFAAAGVDTEVNASLCETPYPVRWVVATPNEADTECLVEWSLPMGPYAIIYDDGEANDYAVWNNPGGAVGVHFTPAGYPATVLGGSINVGDGSFPAGGDFLGSQMAVGVMDDDGPNGLPGTLYDSVIVDVGNYGWVEFPNIFNTIFTEGDFYIVMWQLGFANNSAPVAVDTDLPTTYRSAAKLPGMDWGISPYQDFMIRAVVDGPNEGVVSNAVGSMVRLPKITEGPFLATSKPKGINGTIKDGEFRPMDSENATRDMTNYIVERVSDFDPDMGPETGTHTVLANPTVEEYNDVAWGGLPEGFYAYCVKAVYESGESDCTYSNVVAHLLDNEFTVEVSLCDGNDPDDALVILAGQDYPYHTLTGVTDIDGIVVFDSVIDGYYDLFVEKVGYTIYEHYDLAIFGDMTYPLVLTEKAYPPRNFVVDPLTSHATWDEPLITALITETFEDATFPPAGWQTTTADVGWFRGNDDGPFEDWVIPGGDGWYAVANDDLAGSVSDGSMDYLITPELDLRESDEFMLEFSSYYDAQYGQSAYIEYSYDNGATWEVLETMSPSSDWTDISIDLGLLSGMDSSPVWIAFHSDDNGEWASGWAVDNVVVWNGPSPILGYWVYLNDAMVGTTDVDTREWTYVDLQYGQTYEGCVRALYACGLSDPVCYTWNSTYLHPPRELGDEYVYGTNEVPLMWLPPMTGTIPMTSAFKVVYVGPHITSVKPGVETSPEVTLIEFENPQIARDFGDVQFTIPNAATAVEAGCETDGEFIYTSLWDGAEYYKYDLAGNMVESFSISGTANVRDMAYDGQYFYGAAANTTVYVMDFETQTLVTSFTAPTACRAIAYNHVDDVFYGCDWSTDIVTFDESGANLGSFPSGLTGVYGLAFDNWSDGNNQFLWAYDQGADNLIQYSLPGGSTTGLTLDVAGITGSSGGAGGAYTQPALWDPAKVTIGGNAQADVLWGIELADYSGQTGGSIPQGLVSFNVYRDGVNIANVPYEGQAVDEYVYYVDNLLDPACYLYDVTAVYDLTDYGFPGEFGESAWEGTDTVCVVWGFELPFFEGWDQGSFTFQEWRFNDNYENWMINSDVGNPEPSAQFNWDPLLELDYSSTLTSNPITADLLTEGYIYLDFDLMLEDRNSTGEEKLLVEVYNGESWNQVAEFSNNGSFDWESSHLDISSFAMSRVFQVRFNAVGQNSFDVIAWLVDNIHIYRECGAPEELTGEYKWNATEDLGAEVCWDAPFVPEPISEWVHWDDGTPSSTIGLTDGGTFLAAARWDAGQLSEYAGTSITKMQVAIGLDYTNVTLKIWTGANAANLIFEEDVTSSIVANAWNEFELPSPIALDVSQELYVGYSITHGAGAGPALADAGPADAGYGDLLSTDGSSWISMANEYGLNYNWNIQFYVTEVSAVNSPVTLINNTEFNNLSTDMTVAPVTGNLQPANTETTREITGFNVYRMLEDQTEYELYDFVEYVSGQSAYCYWDAVPEVDIQKGYYYQVTATYASDTDECESPAAMAKENDDEDFVYVFITGIDNPDVEALTNVYPNPAQDMVTVTSSLPMSKVIVTNYVGQVVYTGEEFDATSVELYTSNYQAGVYLVKIYTENGVVTKQVVISR